MNLDSTCVFLHGMGESGCLVVPVCVLRVRVEGCAKQHLGFLAAHELKNDQPGADPSFKSSESLTVPPRAGTQGRPHSPVFSPGQT